MEDQEDIYLMSFLASYLKFYGKISQNGTAELNTLLLIYFHIALQFTPKSVYNNRLFFTCLKL